MANYLTTDTDLTSVANAIRTKGGTSAQLAFPAGFVSAIDAIPTGGGAQKVLLASGTYTNASDVAGNTGLTIPVTYTGTPSEFFVNKTDAVVDSSTIQAVSWFTYYDGATAVKDAFPGNELRTVRYMTTAGAYGFGYPLAATLSSNSIFVRAQTSGHKLKAGTYAWYIWGYAT